MSAPWQRMAAATAPPTALPPPAGPAPAAYAPREQPGEVLEEVPGEVRGLAVSVAELDELADLPVSEHVARYDALHGRLSDALASIDGI